MMISSIQSEPRLSVLQVAFQIVRDGVAMEVGLDLKPAPRDENDMAR